MCVCVAGAPPRHEVYMHICIYGWPGAHIGMYVCMYICVCGRGRTPRIKCTCVHLYTNMYICVAGGAYM